MIRKHALKTIIGISLVALAAGILVAGCGRGGGSMGQVVAKVDGKPITLSQLCQTLELSDNGAAGRQALEALIMRQLVKDEAEKRGIKLDDKVLQERIDGLKDYILAGAGMTFDQWLKSSGQTPQDIADRVGIQVLTAKLVLTDQERQKYFEQPQTQQRLKTVPSNNEAVIYRQIIVGTKSEADAIRSQLLKTAGSKPVSDTEFAKVADERSLDPMTRGRGGMRGWWIKGQAAQTKEPSAADVEKALFALKPGELSQSIATKVTLSPTQTGQAPQQAPEQWRIVLVDKHIMPHPITLAANQDIIEDWMLNDPQYQFQLQQFFENLKSKAKVEVMAPRYQSVADEYAQRNQARQQMQQQMPSAMPPAGAPGAPAPQMPAPQGGAGRAGGR